MHHQRLSICCTEIWNLFAKDISCSHLDADRYEEKEVLPHDRQHDMRAVLEMANPDCKTWSSDDSGNMRKEIDRLALEMKPDDLKATLWI